MVVSGMTIAAKVTFLFITTSLLLVSLATGYVAQQEYEAALQELIAEARARTENRPTLQYAVYRQDGEQLQLLLPLYFNSDTITGAAADNNQGIRLASLSSNLANTAHIPSLGSLRTGVPVSLEALVAHDDSQGVTDTGFWTALMADSPDLYFSLPIYSPINLLSREYTLADFVAANSTREETHSLAVLGYIQLQINEAALLDSVRPVARSIFLIGLSLLALCALPVFLYSRRATLPAHELNSIASRILSGKIDHTLKAKENPEFPHIAQLLNETLASSTAKEEQTELEQKLLVMAAGERASELSLREQELSKAEAEIAHTKAELHRLSNFDHLTSLPNRNLFAEQLNLLLRLSARSGDPLAVLVITIDNFRSINDSLGRTAGEQLLKEVANRIVSILRSSDVVAKQSEPQEDLNASRLGDHEFALLLSQLESIESAGPIAERIAEHLMQPMVIENQELVIMPKIGIAVSPRHGLESGELLRNATAAMHHARLENGATFQYYQNRMQGNGHSDLKIEAELRKAAQRGEFKLLYQPQVDISNGAVVCAEALLRWEHPELGLVSPAHFIQLAEKTGLMWEIGDWVMVEACHQVNLYREQGITLSRIAINISPHQVKPEFVTRLQEVLRAADLEPSMIELELSEAILVHGNEVVSSFLQELKALGIYLSLDNFGTSHAPIEYLSRYPLDEIKIDRSFVSACDKKKSQASLVKAIIAMADSLDLPTSAEGVETDDECRFLASCGVVKMRGYLFSKPVPAAELQAQLAVPWHYMGQVQRMAILDDLKKDISQPLTEL